MRRSQVVAGVAASVLSIGAAGAVAASSAPSGGPTTPAAPLSQEFQDELTSSHREWAKKQPKLKDRKRPSKSELTKSAREHRGRKTAGEARDQIGSLAPSLTTNHSLIPDPADVVVPVAPNALRLKGKDGKPGGAMVSNMPLVVPPADGDDAKKFKNWKLADLDLTSDGDRYRTGRTYLPVSVPKTADGEVRVDDLSARFAPEGSDSTASVDGESVTYPNVSTDTDLTLRTSSIGVKAGWTLRSPAAPSTLKVPLELPAGATAKVADDHGTITIVDRVGETIGALSAPSAIDSAAFPVEVVTTLKDDVVQYAVQDREGETAYPVAVDPVFSKNWEAGAVSGDFSYWYFGKSRPQVPFAGATLSDPAYGQFRGLEVYGNAAPAITSSNPNGYGSGDWATFARYAPGNQQTGNYFGSRRVASDHGYWYRADLTGIDYSFTASQWYHVAADPNPTFTFLPYTGNFPGITQRFTLNSGGTSYGPYDGGATNFNNNTLGASVTLWTPSGSNVNDPNGAVNSRSVVANRPDNLFVAGLFDRNQYGGNGRPAAAVFLGGYTLYASDDVAPTVATTSPTGPADWTDDPTTVPGTVNVTAKDNGTGVLTTQLRNSAGTAIAQPANYCPVVQEMLCAYEHNTTFSIPTPGEGRTTYTIDATDASGTSAANGLTTTVANRKTLSYGIDTTDPSEPTVSGTLFTQRDSEIGATEARTLTVTGNDGVLNGSLSQQQSGVQRVEVYVDGELKHSANQSVAGDSQPLTTTWVAPAGTFTSGNYDVRVVVIDRLGHERDLSFPVKASCCGTSLTAPAIAVGDRLYEFGDVDGDNVSDLVLVNITNGAISVRLGAGDGTFSTETSWGSFGVAVDKIAIGDIDGAAAHDDDVEAGQPEIPELDDLVARGTSGTLVMRRSTGTAFTAPTSGGYSEQITSWPAARSLRLADVDGDFNADLWGSDSGTGALSVAYSDGDGFFGDDVWITQPSTLQVHLADLDGDDAADLVSYDPSNGAVRFRPSEGDGFGTAVDWGVGPTSATAITGDVDGDGRDDLVFRASGSPGTVTARLSSQDGGFVGGSQNLGTQPSDVSIASTDLTGDGREDVLGTKRVGTNLQLTPTQSAVPSADEPDTRPIDPNQPGDEAPDQSARSRPTDVTLMMSDDAGLTYGQGLGGIGPGSVPRENLLDQMKYLGATRIRLIVYWGQVDRLHPDDRVEVARPAAGGPLPADTAHGLMLKDGEAAAPTAAQTNANVRPAATAVRKFVFARDLAANLPAGGGRNDTLRADLAAKTEANTVPEYIGGEWRIVEHRYYLQNIRDAITKIQSKSMSVHLTLTGAAKHFECKSGSVPDQGSLRVRGCVNPNANQTGVNPDPTAYGQFVGDLTKQLRDGYSPPSAADAGWDAGKSGFGTTLFSVGLWNEPNYDTFLRVPESTRLHDAAPLYGQLYAAGYKALNDRGMVGPVRVAFGELSSDENSYVYRKSNNKPGKRKQPPSSFVERAVNSASEVSGVWGGGPVRAFAFAVHPYQHGTNPSKPDGRSQFGVYGVGQKPTGGGKSVKSTLSGLAPAKLLKPNATSSAPEIWATEFGYYATRGNKVGIKDRSLYHTEDERKKWMVGPDGSTGALNRLVDRGNAKVIGLWEALEDPPTTLTANAGSTTVGLQADYEYGFIGSGIDRTHPTYTEFGGSNYTGQIFKVGVNSVKPYGKTSALKRPTSAAARRRWYGYAYPQKRALGCAVRKWSGVTAGPAMWTPPGTTTPTKLPSCAGS